MERVDVDDRAVETLRKNALEALQTVSKSKNSTNYRGVELFFSFDIVNSSGYKERNRFDWPLVLRRLLNTLQNQVVRKFEGSAILWRVIGDELIFATPISEIDAIHENIKLIFGIVSTLSFQLKTGDFFKTFFPEKEYKHLYTSNTLSIKAAAWIAIVARCEELSDFENLSVSYARPENQGDLQEFLGPDIDAGFRVKQYTKAERLAVSFELACILSERTESLRCLHIMSYQHLKGVWHEGYYPIIWYHSPQVAGNIEFRDSFRYDERATDQIICKYLERDRLSKDEVDPESKISVRMYYDVIYAIQKLKADYTLDPKIQAIKKAIIESQNFCVKSPTLFFEDSSRLKMHFAVVCYYTEQRAVLIAKRSDSKSFLPGVWEFGCVKSIFGNDLIEKIKQEYKNDFGVEIELVVDQDRVEDMQPIPLAIYSIDQSEGGKSHESRKEIGLILLAKIIKPFEIEKFQPTGKHSKLRWIREDEVADFGEDAVSDFKETLKKAFAEIRVRFQSQTEDETDGKR